MYGLTVNDVQCVRKFRMFKEFKQNKNKTISFEIEFITFLFGIIHTIINDAHCLKISSIDLAVHMLS